MYKYQDYSELTPEHIFQKISQEEIFSKLFKEPISLYDRYTSPLRIDDTPKCRFQYYGDELFFIDFGDVKKTHRNCFRMIMDLYSVSYTSALSYVCELFDLSLNVADYQIVKPKGLVKTSIKEVVQIITNDRAIEKRDIKFWSQFLITPNNLEEDNIKFVTNFTILKENSTKTITPFTICSKFSFDKRVKLYMPYNNPEYKWLTNCNHNDLGNIENIPARDELLIIAKSYKDHRVLRNLDLGLNVIWVHNETCIPDEDIIADLGFRFKKIILFYDNDNAGREGSKKLAEVFNSTCQRDVAKAVTLPKKCPYKDPGEFINKEGRKDLYTVVKKLIK